jgi:hypothetical protein
MLFGIPMVAVIGGLFIEALKILKGSPQGVDPSSPGSDFKLKFITGKGQLSSEETQMMQDLFKIASRMEQRIEALETLIMDRVRDAEKEESFH